MPPFDGAPAVHVRDHQPVIVATDDDFRQLAADKELADYVGVTLAAAYPGYRWRVEPFSHPTKPFIQIRCEHTNARFSTVVQPWRFSDATQYKADIVRKAGELLERFGMSRRAFDVAQYKTKPFHDRPGLWLPDGVNDARR